MASLCENLNIPPCIWFEGESRRNTIASMIAGALFFVGWWILIDAASVHTGTVAAGYHMCGVAATVSLVMVNSVSNAQIRGDAYEGGCLGPRGSRIWLFLGFVMGFASVIASCWILFADFVGTAPSRGALLAARCLGIDVDVQLIDLFAKKQLEADFVKINPQHTVPTLVDGDFTLWESRAIAAYLVRTYGKDDSLYPTDPKERALVDQRLQFDCGTLYPRIRAICFPILFLGEVEVFDEHKASLDEALGFLDVFLEGTDFACGNKLTIADCSLIASVSSIEAVGWDLSPYTNVKAWVSKCSLEIPDYATANQAGADQFGKAVKNKMAPGQL